MSRIYSVVLSPFQQCLAAYTILLMNDLADNAQSRFVSEHPSFDTISSLVRMGHKYEIHSAMDSALAYLRSYYPSDFMSWKANKKGAPKFQPVHSIGVLNLARLTEAFDMIPAAFWICCNLDIEDLRGGFKRQDGTHETLSTTDLVNVLIAREELAKMTALGCLCVLDIIAGSRSCTCDDSDSDCQSSVSAVVERLAESDTDDYIGPTLTGCWVRFLNGELSVSFCSDSVEAIKEKQKEQLREAWDRLPGFIASS